MSGPSNPRADRSNVDLHLASEDMTRRLAESLAPILGAGDVLLLSGEVGAGKTAFARALIQASLLQDGLPPEDVPSPTFTLVQTYPGKLRDIWHADLYRVSDPDEVLELGLTEAFDDALCLIEWPDRLGMDRPAGAELSWSVGPQDGRRVTLSPGPLTRRILDRVTETLPEIVI